MALTQQREVARGKPSCPAAELPEGEAGWEPWSLSLGSSHHEF